MKLKGEIPVRATREIVWRALNDPETLRQCIPGCESLVRISDTELEAVVLLVIGPVRASFRGRVLLSDLEPPVSCTLRGEGKGGAAGFARGQASIRLEETDGITLLTYTARADTGGRLAQLGARLMDASARKLSGEFFRKFTTIVEAAARGNAAREEREKARAEGKAGSRRNGLLLRGALVCLLVLLGILVWVT